MKRQAIHLLLSIVALLIWHSGILPEVAQSAQQFQGLCARIKMEILQELTLERIGFLATLEITNNEVDADITDFSALLTFENPALSQEGSPNDSSDLFFVQPPELEGITAINGTGIIPPTKTAVIRWFIIPKIDAGGTAASGLQYRVGAKLGGSIYGKEIAPEVLEVIPDTITVKPEPQLEITYFQPRDVDGDDPFTQDFVESPIPFTLGVLVKNVGYGRAKQVKIDSQQPRIVENKQGLLLIAQLLGSRVDDQPTDEKSLTINMGDIEPARCRKGAWDMMTSLSGEFIEFKASFTHASELGGKETSVIKEINAHFIAREVLNDQPGRDKLLDFLADTDRDAGMLPDTLYESDCNIVPVNHLPDLTVSSKGSAATATVRVDREGWVYMRMNDPGQGKYPLISVLRSDGKLLNSHNYWTNIRYEKGTNRKLIYLNLFDFVSLGDYQYTVSYGEIERDTVPPETRLRLAGQMKEIEGKYYILPQTQIYFTAEDASPVATYYKLDEADEFVPAYPFNISSAGEHFIEYYSVDRAGNEESHKIASIVVSLDYPEIDGYVRTEEQIYVSGEALSIRPSSLNLNFQGSSSAGKLMGEIEVFRGVVAWPTLSGIPSSPTRNTEAVITIGGLHVDYYRYRLGQAAWSQELPTSSPIMLSGLESGAVKLSVNGRSKYGSYLPEQKIVTSTWVVDPEAPPTVIAGIPPSPTNSLDATLQVSGVDLYRHNLDNSYYRPEAVASTLIELRGLPEGSHSLSVIGKVGEEPWQSQDNPTTVSWQVDRWYGFDLSSLPRVRSILLENVAPNITNYQWDGRNDQGDFVPAGWYTVRLTIRDELGRSAQALKLVQIGQISEGTLLLAGAASAQKNIHAYGGWAVWQDQRNDNWDIYALNLAVEGAPVLTITDNPLNQEDPKTDGLYVVWQDRQPDGNWDIWARELRGESPSFPVTSTTDHDDMKPVVYWPWIVYQSKDLKNPSSPWQLMAYHMITKKVEPVDPTAQDQLDPALYKGRVVWQDFRDPGWGEIYFKDLKRGQILRLTNDIYSQYTPVIHENWIVWSDKRGTQSDLYGYNLLRQAEVRLTNTPESETRPSINGLWVVYEEDSAGAPTRNLRVLHLSNLTSIQLTNALSEKERPFITSSKLIWMEKPNGISKVVAGNLPVLQPVYNNQNMVIVTGSMASYLKDAYSLLTLWNIQAGVTAVTRYTSLLPSPVAETVMWEGAGPVGNNFNLEPNSFLWVRFSQGSILDLGDGSCQAIALASGINVFSYTCFPDAYTAYNLIREIGIEKIRGLRTLNSGTGRWLTATVVHGRVVGEDFHIPRVSVLMVDMETPVSQWRPGY